MRKIICIATLLFFTLNLNCTDLISIRKKAFPLPEKYRNSKSSEQGLRQAIPNVTVNGDFSIEQYHYAVDYACPDKTEVYACDDGFVINVYPSYYNGGKEYNGHKTYGGLIEIRHLDGTTSLYAHLSMTKVLEGSYVRKGQLIGLSGGVYGRRGSGSSTAPHLHFCIYLNIEDMFE